MADTPKLLDDLLRTAAPSGYEGPASAVWRKAASFAEIATDGIGSSIATIGDGEGPLVAVVGHIDEIGLVITHVDEKGMIWFESIGGWDAQILVGQRVEIQTKEGPLCGVAGRKPIHLLKDDQRKKAVELSDLHIDIGATDGDEAKSKVRIGDPVVIAAEPVRLLGDRLVSRSMDNRLGAYTALESLRRVHEDGGPVGKMAGIAAAQEEIGLFGARTSAFHLRPDVAVAGDVTHATDAPGVDEKEHGSHPLGSGPVIGRGSTLSPIVHDLLVETAESEGIEYTVAGSGRYTGTDADAIQISRSGVPAGLVSIPLRYMHSSVEMVDLGDVENVVRLITAFAKSLKADVDFSR
ncbi:M42 family metallopeptidase [soil metagenome]